MAAVAATGGAQTPGRRSGSTRAACRTAGAVRPRRHGQERRADSRCFELRTYTVRAEGPGSIDLLHSRFREHTTRLFKKHGMEIIGFWHATSKPNTLIYVLAYKDRAARDAAWKAFQSDPEWVKVRTEMQVGTQVESVFMNAVDYGPMK